MNASLESDDEQREAAQLWLQYRSSWGGFQHRLRQLFVRTARVIVSAVIGLDAHWIGIFTGDIIHRIHE